MDFLSTILITRDQETPYTWHVSSCMLPEPQTFLGVLLNFLLFSAARRLQHICNVVGSLPLRHFQKLFSPLLVIPHVPCWFLGTDASSTTYRPLIRIKTVGLYVESQLVSWENSFRLSLSNMNSYLKVLSHINYQVLFYVQKTINVNSSASCWDWHGGWNVLQSSRGRNPFQRVTSVLRFNW